MPKMLWKTNLNYSTPEAIIKTLPVKLDWFYNKITGLTEFGAETKELLVICAIYLNEYEFYECTIWILDQMKNMMFKHSWNLGNDARKANLFYHNFQKHNVGKQFYNVSKFYQKRF